MRHNLEFTSFFVCDEFTSLAYRVAASLGVIVSLKRFRMASVLANYCQRRTTRRDCFVDDELDLFWGILLIQPSIKERLESNTCHRERMAAGLLEVRYWSLVSKG